MIVSKHKEAPPKKSRLFQITLIHLSAKLIASEIFQEGLDHFIMTIP